MTRKKSLAFLLSAIGAFVLAGIVLLTLFLCGVIYDKNKIFKINQIQGFAYFSNEAVCIDAEFCDNYVGQFEITERSEIEEISGIILARRYTRDDRAFLSPGSNICLTFTFADGRQIKFFTRMLRNGNMQYFPNSADNLDALLTSIGLEQGKIVQR